MTEFTIHDEQSAPVELTLALEQARRRFGFIPNLYGIMAESPQALNAYQGLAEQFTATSLGEDAQQVVLLTASRRNTCHYCMAVHSTTALKSGVDSAIVEALRDGKALPDERLEAVRRFTDAVVVDRGDASEEEVAAFLAAGYERRQILDVMVGVAMKTLSNYINHVAHTPVDEAFSPQAWSA